VTGAARVLALTLALGVARLACAAGDESSLSIQLVPPAAAGAQRWSIYLDGMFDPGAAQRLSDELAQRDVREATVYFNSPGGLLSEGMALGRLIRERGFATSVGRRNAHGFVPFAGACYSACVLAFIGGVYRFDPSASRLGVHRFWTPSSDAADADTAQIISASIVTYMRDMRVDVGLFERMTRVGRDRILLLGRRELAQLRVTNDGRLGAKWALDARDGDNRLRGEQQTWRGKGTIVLSCEQGGILFRPTLELDPATAIDSDSIAQHLIGFGTGYLPLGDPLDPIEVQDGRLSGRFLLDGQQVEELTHASSVGYAARLNGPRMMAAFRIDATASDREQIKAFVGRCAR
jgi:hypothetical protein